MPKNLVIVESPAKAKTISHFLDKKTYEVVASMGHLRDLPKGTLGIDIEHDFEPKYVIPKLKAKTVAELKKIAKNKTDIILATDEDREGEAIAWHLAHILDLNSNIAKRIVFHEITPNAIKEALENPRQINTDLVDSQQARRILDRLVGYKLSPFLWKKIMKGLSAGRVQTPALRLIVEREKEIADFKPQEYWEIQAKFQKDKNIYQGNLFQINKKNLDRFDLSKKEACLNIEKEIENKDAKVIKITTSITNKKTLPPFTTSTLQQASWQILRFSVKKTMMIAQRLYEGIDLGSGRIGLITYMRTDSVNLSSFAIATSREYIKNTFGEKYLPEKQNFFKAKSNLAQEAHEAIRATEASRTPESIAQFLSNDEQKLYRLIWQRFIACQMNDAKLEKQEILTETIETKNIYTFKSNYQKIAFDGFLKVLPLDIENSKSPDVKENEIYKIKEIISSQHFTDPPARYNDASLVKTLEKYGIGRPSTYATIISVLLDRGYVSYNEGKAFIPSDIGTKTCNMLVENFPNIADYQMTANLEENLDLIAEGKNDWHKLLKEFYFPFEELLTSKYEEVKKIDLIEDNHTDEICPKCNSPLIMKMSRFGKFLACSKFPECKFTKSINQETGIKCPKCKTGDVIMRKSKRRKIFYGCSNYPNCDFIINKKPLKENCPTCGYPLIIASKQSHKCSNKECKYVTRINADI